MACLSSWRNPRSAGDSGPGPQTMMTAVGGLLVIAIGLRLLGLARIRAANQLPAVLLAPLATGVVAAIRA